jgi:hypothetical protein
MDALRKALCQVEEQAGLAPDDLCLIELKRILLSRIVELEAVEFATDSSENRQPTIAALHLANSPNDQPAVVMAVDLAITLVTDYLFGRPTEHLQLATDRLPVDRHPRFAKEDR